MSELDIDGKEPRSDLMLYEVWRRFTYPLINNLTLKGHSRAAEKTCFLVSELGLYLDGALQCYTPPLAMCITHGHSDHSTAIPMIITTNTPSPEPIMIYVPLAVQNLFENYLQSHFQLNCGTSRACNRIYKMEGKIPGDIWRLFLKGRDYQFEAYKCYHSVPTIGYGISEVKKKLKPELQAQIAKMEGPAIGAFRKELQEKGESLTHEVLEPLFVYLCDTTAQVFEDQTIFRYPRIIVEVTNIYEKDEHYANKNKHICWNQIREIVRNHPGNLFILIHFSMRYTWEEIDECFSKEREDEGITNIYIWKN